MSQTCKGKRQMWRGRVLGTFKCGRKATYVMETRVGLTRRTPVCDGVECSNSIAQGYPASFRKLG